MLARCCWRGAAPQRGWRRLGRGRPGCERYAPEPVRERVGVEAGELAAVVPEVAARPVVRQQGATPAARLREVQLEQQDVVLKCVRADLRAQRVEAAVGSILKAAGFRCHAFPAAVRRGCSGRGLLPLSPPLMREREGDCWLSVRRSCLDDPNPPARRPTDSSSSKDRRTSALVRCAVESSSKDTNLPTPTPTTPHVEVTPYAHPIRRTRESMTSPSLLSRGATIKDGS